MVIVVVAGDERESRIGRYKRRMSLRRKGLLRGVRGLNVEGEGCLKVTPLSFSQNWSVIFHIYTEIRTPPPRCTIQQRYARGMSRRGWWAKVLWWRLQHAMATRIAAVRNFFVLRFID